MDDKTKGRGKMKMVSLRLAPDQIAWLRARPKNEISDTVRMAIDILRNWFDICPVTGSVTPKSVVARMCPDSVFIEEMERRFVE